MKRIENVRLLLLLLLEIIIDEVKHIFNHIRSNHFDHK